MFDVEELLVQASAETGLQDYGRDDFLEPLGILVNALNTEANLNDFGEMLAGMTLQAGLCDRLRIHDYISRHPDVLELKVERPIFIVGLPRTGTTALHHMLNHDSRNHTLRLWEVKNPVPPAEDATYESDPRIAECRENVAMTEMALPGFMKTHLLEAEEPDECYLLFNRNFMSVEYSAMFHIPSYANWLYAQDVSKSYAYHKQQLQLLQHKKSGQWVLKAPYHQLGLEAILQQYPDALIVQTHRSPTSFVGSGCSFSELLRKGGSDYVDPKVIGKDWMDLLRAYTSTFEAARTKLEPQFPGQFVDLYHDDFVQDPWPGIELIYQRGGRELTAEGRASMQQWQDDHPKGKHGKHEYSLEKYGITQAELESVFGDYVKRYDIGME